MASIPLFTLSIMKVYCHKHYEECVIKPRQYWDVKLMKEMTTFAGWNLFGVTGSMVGNFGLGIVLNSFFGTILNAAFGIANQLNGLLLTFSNAMLKALNPVIVKKEGEGSHESMMDISLSGCRFSFILFAVFCIPCFVEAPFVLRIWLKDYPEWTILFVRYQIVRTLLEQTVIVLGTTLSATGKVKEVNVLNLVIQLLPIVVVFVVFHFGASPYWFYPIVIFDMVVVASGVRMFYCRKYCGLRVSEFIRTVLIPCVLMATITICVGWLIQSTMQMGIVRFSLNTFVMTILTCVLSLMMLSKNEKDIIKSLTAKLIIKR